YVASARDANTNPNRAPTLPALHSKAPAVRSNRVSALWPPVQYPFPKRLKFLISRPCFQLVKTARCAVRTLQRGIPTIRWLSAHPSTTPTRDKILRLLQEHATPAVIPNDVIR